jgi:hypothetical protein
VARMKDAPLGPLSVLDLLLADRPRNTDGPGWYRENRAAVLAHMDGAPCRFGKDGRQLAARLVVMYDADAETVRAARAIEGSS